MHRSIVMSMVLLMSLAAAWLSAATTERRPNIVIFIADDHGRDDYSFRGHPDLATPAVDALRQRGMWLTRMASPTAMCAPARSALYTGLWPQRNGCYMNHGETRRRVRALPHYLEPLGYRVVLAGKSHVKPSSVYAFETQPLIGPRNSRTFDFEALAEVFNGSQPFCVIAASNEPHAPHGEPAHDPASITVPAHLADTPVSRSKWVHYLGDVQREDAELARIMALLDASGQRDHTLVIYTSDHGYSTFGKWSCYDRGLEVTTVAAWPGHIAPGSSSDALISFVDLVPTLVEVAGGSPPAVINEAASHERRSHHSSIDGRSFAGVLQGQTDHHRDYLFGIHTNRGTSNGSVYPIRSVRNERYKLIRNYNHTISQTNVDNYMPDESPRPGSVLEEWLSLPDHPAAQARLQALRSRPPVELYDLVNDREELTNLAGDPALAAVQAELEQRLDVWLGSLSDEPMRLEQAVADRRRDPTRRR